MTIVKASSTDFGLAQPRNHSCAPEPRGVRAPRGDTGAPFAARDAWCRGPRASRAAAARRSINGAGAQTKKATRTDGAARRDGAMTTLGFAEKAGAEKELHSRLESACALRQRTPHGRLSRAGHAHRDQDGDRHRYQRCPSPSRSLLQSDLGPCGAAPGRRAGGGMDGARRYDADARSPRRRRLTRLPGSAPSAPSAPWRKQPVSVQASPGDPTPSST